MKQFINSFGNWLDITKAYAQDLIPCPDGTMADPMIGCVTMPGSVANPESGIAELILQIASTFMAIVAIAAVVMLIVGGITYALSAGDDEKIRNAKRMMFWSIFGLIVALVARFTAQLVLDVII